MKTLLRNDPDCGTGINRRVYDARLCWEMAEDPATLYSSVLRSREFGNGTSKLLLGFIKALSKVVEMRDFHTATHQRRVTRIARAVAKEIALSEECTVSITVSGLLHDIGKVCLPSGILNKSGSLTDAEVIVIRCHPAFGYEILKEIGFEWPVADIVLQHHERLDGSGYPNGLVGNQIRLEAQVLSVADVVDAMSAHRPYRPSLGIEQAMNEITDKSGTLFNPEIVAACIKVCQELSIASPRPGNVLERGIVESGA